MAEKIKIELGEVQETLLLPLTARVIETQRKNGILKDPTSVEISKKLQINIKSLERKISEIGIAGLAVRAIKMDEEIKKFQEKHPKGKIITLGVGLDTYFYRCDKGQNLWYDIDLEDSIELRKKVLPIPNERVHYITKSLFDISWIHDIGNVDDGVLILVPGVFPYFDENEIRNFLTAIAPKLTHAKMVFDIISLLGLNMVNQQFKNSGMTKAQLKWGIIDAHEIESWSPHIAVEEAEPFFKNIHSRGRYFLPTTIIMQLNDLFRTTQIVKLKFK